MPENFLSEKRYMLDTNIFRYKIDSSSHYRNEAKKFWTMILSEMEIGESEIFVPHEVLRELEIQSYLMMDKEKRRLDAVRGFLTILPEINNRQAEHMIRKISAYIRSNYKKELDVIKRGVEYPSVSDSRILLNAWQYDCILVTANIKDFMLFPLLFDSDALKLYDPITENYVVLDPIVHETITNDEQFNVMKQELVQLLNY